MNKFILTWRIIPLVLCAALLPTGANAQTTSFTATGMVTAVLAPPIVCVDAAGRVSLRGELHTVRLLGSDPRVTGFVTIISDGAYNADGTVNFQGPGYVQVGTWDAAGTNFTPGGGTWVSQWSGVMQTNNSLQLSIAGYRIGGTVDGQRIAATLTRGPAPTAEATNVPYIYSGVIRPPPVSTTLYADNFTHLSGRAAGANGGTATLIGTNQMTLHAQFTSPSSSSANTLAWGLHNQAWTLGAGQTSEVQADLVNLNQAATLALVAISPQDSGSPTYSLARSNPILVYDPGRSSSGRGEFSIRRRSR